MKIFDPILLPTFCFFINSIAYGQSGTAQAPGSQKYTHTIVGINPVRSVVDEVSIFYEWSDLNTRSIGMSLGYIYPNHILGGSTLQSINGTGDAMIRYNSRGIALRAFRKALRNTRSYFNVVGQLRYLNVNDYNHVSGEHLSDDAVDVNIDRTTIISGLQIHHGIISSKSKIFQHEMYAGIGINAIFNVSTSYNSYSAKGAGGTIVPEEYHLSTDDKIRFLPTFHLGYRPGFKFKRRRLK